jgi:hypothetical protein
MAVSNGPSMRSAALNGTRGAVAGINWPPAMSCSRAAGVIGTSRATGRPRSLIWMVTPALAFAIHTLAFWHSSRIPILSMSPTVALPQRQNNRSRDSLYRKLSILVRSIFSRSLV